MHLWLFNTRIHGNHMHIHVEGEAFSREMRLESCTGVSSAVYSHSLTITLFCRHDVSNISFNFSGSAFTFLFCGKSISVSFCGLTPSCRLLGNIYFLFGLVGEWIFFIFTTQFSVKCQWTNAIKFYIMALYKSVQQVGLVNSDDSKPVILTCPCVFAK